MIANESVTTAIVRALRHVPTPATGPGRSRTTLGASDLGRIGAAFAREFFAELARGANVAASVGVATGVMRSGSSSATWNARAEHGAANARGRSNVVPECDALAFLYEQLCAAAQAGRDDDLRRILERVEALEAHEAEHMSRCFWSRMPLRPGTFEALKRETEELLARHEDPSAGSPAGDDGD